MLTITDKDYKVLTFSGGEQHVELLDNFNHIDGESVQINKRIQKSSDIMDLLLLVDILRSHGAREIGLRMPYIPYARQDRRTTPNTAQSLKVFAELINDCSFSYVQVLDPHSMVAENLIDNMVGESVVSYLNEFIDVVINPHDTSISVNDIVLVSPDVGAIKKIESYAKQLRIPNVIAFHKERNPATGDIVSTKQISGNEIILNDKYVFIVDDICDYGNTFVKLLDACPQLKTAKSLNLFVTHGIFAGGLTPLYRAGFNNIGSTNSFIGRCHENTDLKIIPLHNF